MSGTQIPNCLRATVFDAVCYGYRAVMLSDACSAQTPQVAEANYRDICGIGAQCLSLEQFAAEPPISGISRAC